MDYGLEKSHSNFGSDPKYIPESGCVIVFVDSPVVDSHEKENDVGKTTCGAVREDLGQQRLCADSCVAWRRCVTQGRTQDRIDGFMSSQSAVNCTSKGQDSKCDKFPTKI